jgi:nicotinamidase-related amidase
MVRRIVLEHCCGTIIDVQSFFLAQLGKRDRSRIVANTANLVRLLGYFEIPIVATVERPVDRKGLLPKQIGKHLSDHLSDHLGDRAVILEKSTFDLCKEKTVRRHLARLNKKQVIVAGCETDVCVLQSCLGLLSLGYEVYLVEEALFSSSRNVAAAIARMEAEGAMFVSYKTLFYELIESVDGRSFKEKGRTLLRPFPEDIPDTAMP